MDLLGLILKKVDLDLDVDDVLETIHRVSPTIAFVLALIIGLGGVIMLGVLFYEYMQMP